MRIEVDGLYAGMGRTCVLHDITTHAVEGQITGLLGPNGSGKSTLLRVLAGLLRPQSGAVRVGEVDVHAIGARERARTIALVEQQVDSMVDLTVQETVELGRTPFRGIWPADGDDHELAVVRRAMREAQVEQLASRRWATLSGGERQRTQLARALAQQPGVLLLDEPTNHLDLGHQLQFLASVRDLGVTTVAALHDLELAAAFCDRLVVLDHGRLVAQGSPDDVLTSALLREVYEVEAQICPHPVTGRPHLQWTPPARRRRNP